MLKVRRATKLATSSESGVTTTTTAAMRASTLNMKPSVPTMVMTPEKSCVKPISRPSETWLTSVMTRLNISPWLLVSMVLSGTTSSLSMACRRMSRATP